MAGDQGPHIVFVIEGGRSRADVAAILAVAQAVERSGAVVKVVRHGLGRVSARAVRRAIAEHAPNVVVTTGATSNRDADGMQKRRGFAVVCYYWPAGPIEDIHRRPRHRGKSQRRPAKVSIPTHAVLGSELHQSALRSYLGSAAERVEVQVLPPLLDDPLFGESGVAPPVAETPLIGVYGGQGRNLPAGPGYRLVDLDAGPAALLSSTEAVKSEFERLRECDAVLLCGCKTAEEREAPRRCATALLLGKPILVSGFGDHGDGLPLSLTDLALASHDELRQAKAEQLPDALAQLATDLPRLSRRSPPGLREALSPTRVLQQHAELLTRIAQRTPRKKPSIASRLLARLRTLLRRKKAS